MAGLVVYAERSTSPQNTQVAVENFPEVTDKDIITGNKNAKVTIVEYADFQCPACASYNSISNQVLSEYKDQVRIVYRHFPLRGAHQHAVISGQAAYAAWKLGKFSEMKDLLFEKQNDWATLGDPKETFESYASSIGLDVDEFRKIMNSEEAKKAVEDGESEALSLGLNSTPSFFIGSKRFSPQGFDGFKQAIDQELAK